jgi:hypothetical protein
MISVQKNEQKEVLSLDGIDGMTTEAIRKWELEFTKFRIML